MLEQNMASTNCIQPYSHKGGFFFLELCAVTLFYDTIFIEARNIELESNEAWTKIFIFPVFKLILNSFDSIKLIVKHVPTT